MIAPEPRALAAALLMPTAEKVRRYFDFASLRSG